MLNTSVQADRHGPSITTRSPEARTRSNSWRDGVTGPPGLARMRTSAFARRNTRADSMIESSNILAMTIRIFGRPTQKQIVIPDVQLHIWGHASLGTRKPITHHPEYGIESAPEAGNCLPNAHPGTRAGFDSAE